MVKKLSAENEVKPTIELNSEFGNTFQFAAIGMALVNQAGRWIAVNKSLCKILGYTEEELQSLTFQDITHPEDLEKDLEFAVQLFNRKIDSYQIEKRYIKKSGQPIWINLTGSAIWNEDGSFRYFIAQIQDISLRKEALDSLADRERLFRSIFNSTFQFIGFLDKNGVLQEANQTALDFAGIKLEDVAGKYFWDCYWWQISQQTQEKLKYSVARASKGEFVAYEVEVWGRNQIPSTIVFNLKPVFNAENNVLALIAEGRLIQDIVEARNELIQKNQELEQFTSIASHDLREPLRMVKSFGQLLQRNYSQKLDEKGMKYIEMMVDATRRMGNLIEDLLRYSQVGNDQTPVEEVSVMELLDEIKALYGELIVEKNVTLRYGNLPIIQGRRLPLQLLFQNLIGNAMKYQAPGNLPLLSIEVEDVGSFWKFSIADNGIGIEEKYLEDIFGLFKRLHTNQEYPGTGLGLSLCKKIVQQHGGEIWIESEYGKGSTVHFTIKKQ